MKVNRKIASAFTLIEILIVVAIMAICLGIGIPTIFRHSRKDPLQQAVTDIIQGCSDARSRAILGGTPHDFVIQARNGSLSVRKSSLSATESSPNTFSASPSSDHEVSRVTPNSPFSSSLHEDVIVEVIFLNLRDQFEQSETIVRFHPNGMSDELRIILNWRQERRSMITVDPITGVAQFEAL